MNKLAVKTILASLALALAVPACTVSGDDDTSGSTSSKTSGKTSSKTDNNNNNNNNKKEDSITYTEADFKLVYINATLCDYSKVKDWDEDFNQYLFVDMYSEKLSKGVPTSFPYDNLYFEVYAENLTTTPFEFSDDANDYSYAELDLGVDKNDNAEQELLSKGGKLTVTKAKAKDMAATLTDMRFVSGSCDEKSNCSYDKNVTEGYKITSLDISNKYLVILDANDEDDMKDDDDYCTCWGAFDYEYCYGGDEDYSDWDDLEEWDY